MKNTIASPMEAVRHNLCKNCLGIDVRQPFYGPERNRSDSGIITRVCYSHAETSYQLLTSALEQNCQLCCLVLDSIRKHYVLLSNKKNVLDDWDYVDDFDDTEYDDDDDDENDKNDEDNKNTTGVRPKYLQFFNEAEAIYERVRDVASPIILEIVFREPRRDELASRCIDVIVHWTQTGGRARLSSLALNLVSKLSDDLAHLCEARDIRDDTRTGSCHSFELARLWLKQCDLEHELCQKRKEQREILLPTRVIDVRNTDENPRLVEPQKSQSADYVCLSHCWGRISQPFKTEKASLLERMQGIEMKSMPQTFQDAITITRNLGIQYLWIDSLCIIQDSAEDWARESAQMGKIYRDAAITIFAEHADSDDGGCFSTRLGQATALCRTPMFDKLISLLRDQKEDSGSTPAFIQAKLHHAGGHSLPERHSIFETIKTLDRRTVPLNLRAWVLQESILSHRALLYDQHEVRWSCPEMKACECIPEGHTRRSWSQTDKGDAKVIDTRELSNSWANIVHEFSSRSLTYNRDKLPALAGIASEMQRYKHSSYLAGLWQDDLRINLAWFVFPRSAGAPYRKTRRIKNSGIPSWSWAKIEGEIRMRIHYNDILITAEPTSETFNRTQSLLCDILACKVFPLNNINPFGEVRSGFLTLRGRLGRAKCCNPVTDTSHIDRIPIEDPLSTLQTGWFDPDVSPIPREEPIPEIWSMPLYNNAGNPVCLALIPVSAGRAKEVKSEDPSVQDPIFERVGIVTSKMVRSGGDVPTDAMVRSNIAVDQNSAFLAWFESCEVVTVTVV